MSKAAFLQSTNTPFQVLPSPKWDLTSPDELLIRVHAVAINPVDKALQYTPFVPVTYPAVLGQDVAGEVVALGDNTTSRFKIGDRVIGHCMGIVTNRPQDGAFQEHVVLQGNLVSKIPDGMAYERAVVIPLGLSTAAAGFYQEGFMGLRLPGVMGEVGGEVVFIWGGSSSVGCNAIQLAVVAGYEVVTTASVKNAEYLRGLGAKKVLDRRSGSVREDILAALEGKKLAGTLDCIGDEASWGVCLDVAGRHGDGSKLVVTTLPGFPDPAPEGLTIKHMFATTIKDNEVSKAMYEDFLPKALEEGRFVPAPEPDVVGKGLESIQGAVDLYRKGTPSAKKLVVLI